MTNPNVLRECACTTMYGNYHALVMEEKQTEKIDCTSFIALNVAKQYCHIHNLALNEGKQSKFYLEEWKTIVWTPNMEEETKYLIIIVDNALSWT